MKMKNTIVREKLQREHQFEGKERTEEKEKYVQLFFQNSLLTIIYFFCLYKILWTCLCIKYPINAPTLILDVGNIILYNIIIIEVDGLIYIYILSITNFFVFSVKSKLQKKNRNFVLQNNF